MDAPRILVADGDANERETIAGILQDLGAAIVEVTRGIDVLDVLNNQGRISLVVMDVQLVPASGLRVVALARLAGYQGPFILMTSRPNESLRRWSAAMKDTSLLTKPFEAGELIARVKTVGGLGPPADPGPWSVHP